MLDSKASTDLTPNFKLQQIFTWNTDAWGYGPGTTSLYQSHPWVLAVLPNGEALGVLADTTRRCEVLVIPQLSYEVCC